ncbi:hypothetical protein H9P43_001943 [Blastocladiella emersonii ATCC 22665]|nr:hypothetical protein H9P43_001943 [Blastocladiella emersonii ATCC 22665]
MQLLVILALVSLTQLASASPVPGDLVEKRGLFGSDKIDTVTFHRALAKATPSSNDPTKCLIDGTVVARISHYDGFTAGAARLLMKGVTAAIKTEEQKAFFNYVAPFFYANGNEDASVTFTVGGNGSAVAAQKVGGVQAANHGITTTPFSIKNVPCGAQSVPLSVNTGAGFDDARVQVVGNERGAFTVVSDIDDTIRVTEVLNKGKAVENTLINPFRATTNFVDFYARLNKALSTGTAGPAAWHYVSGAPHMLYRPLRDFIARAGYPMGSMFLRVFGVLDLDFWKGTQQHKLTQLREVMTRFDQRSYVLIGDSGEQDPETYGMLYREFAARGVDIKCIYIRKVSGTDAGKEATQNAPARFAKAFEGVPAGKVATFFDPKDVFGADIVNGKCI